MDFSQIDEGRDNEGTEFHYYYNREERIAHAPKIVQDYYNGTGPKVHKNLFRWLVATPFSRVILIMLAAFVVLANVLFRSVPDDWEKDLGDVTVELTAFSYIDNVYASVTCAPKKSSEGKSAAGGEVTAVPVAVVFSTLDEGGNVVSQDRIVAPYDGKEIPIRAEFTDYDIVRITAEVTIGDKTEMLSRQVEKHK